MVPLLSTSKADSGLASEFRWDRAIYTAYERMLKVRGRNTTHQGADTTPTHQHAPPAALIQPPTTTATRLATNALADSWDWHLHNAIELKSTFRIK